MYVCMGWNCWGVTSCLFSFLSMLLKPGRPRFAGPGQQQCRFDMLLPTVTLLHGIESAGQTIGPSAGLSRRATNQVVARRVQAGGVPTCCSKIEGYVHKIEGRTLPR